MKRIIIIGEGPTEQAFCNDVLRPYFYQLGIYVENPTIKKTKGGIVSWLQLKKQIESHLKSDNTAYVTTLIDYYGINDSHEYPSWSVANQNPHKSVRMDILEQSMLNDMADVIRFRFIPYIQLHEFEGLLFSDLNVFNRNFLPEEFNDKPKFTEIFSQFLNPEDINDSPTTAPSKRLLKHIIGYNKIVYGSILAQETGLQQIRTKCPRFNNWVTKIENL